MHEETPLGSVPAGVNMFLLSELLNMVSIKPILKNVLSLAVSSCRPSRAKYTTRQSPVAVLNRQ